jgi:hypothetical protein
MVCAGNRFEVLEVVDRHGGVAWSAWCDHAKLRIAHDRQCPRRTALVTLVIVATVVSVVTTGPVTRARARAGLRRAAAEVDPIAIG